MIGYILGLFRDNVKDNGNYYPQQVHDQVHVRPRRGQLLQVQRADVAMAQDEITRSRSTATEVEQPKDHYSAYFWG